jgi:hypothetical protein
VWALLTFVVMFVAYLATASFNGGEVHYGLAGALLFGAVPMSIIVATLPDHR